MSSIGALDFRLDEWRVDVAVTGSQKALSLPTGLAVMAASPKVSALLVAGTLMLHRHLLRNQSTLRLHAAASAAALSPQWLIKLTASLLADLPRVHA